MSTFIRYEDTHRDIFGLQSKGRIAAVDTDAGTYTIHTNALNGYGVDYSQVASILKQPSVNSIQNGDITYKLSTHGVGVHNAMVCTDYLSRVMTGLIVTPGETVEVTELSYTATHSNHIIHDDDSFGYLFIWDFDSFGDLSWALESNNGYILRCTQEVDALRLRLSPKWFDPLVVDNPERVQLAKRGVDMRTYVKQAVSNVYYPFETKQEGIPESITLNRYQSREILINLMNYLRIDSAEFYNSETVTLPHVHYYAGVDYTARSIHA